MKFVYQYMVILNNFQTTSNHLHPLQVENCDSNSRLVVDEDDNGKFRLERVKHQDLQICGLKLNRMYTSHFYSFEVVGRGNEIQLQVGGNLNYLIFHFKGF